MIYKLATTFNSHPNFKEQVGFSLLTTVFILGFTGLLMDGGGNEFSLGILIAFLVPFTSPFVMAPFFVTIYSIVKEKTFRQWCVLSAGSSIISSIALGIVLKNFFSEELLMAPVLIIVAVPMIIFGFILGKLFVFATQKNKKS